MMVHIVKNTQWSSLWGLWQEFSLPLSFLAWPKKFNHTSRDLLIGYLKPCRLGGQDLAIDTEGLAIYEVLANLSRPGCRFHEVTRRNHGESSGSKWLQRSEIWSHLSNLHFQNTCVFLNTINAFSVGFKAFFGSWECSIFFGTLFSALNESRVLKCPSFTGTTLELIQFSEPKVLGVPQDIHLAGNRLVRTAISYPTIQLRGDFKNDMGLLASQTFVVRIVFVGSQYLRNFVFAVASCLLFLSWFKYSKRWSKNGFKMQKRVLLCPHDSTLKQSHMTWVDSTVI